MLPSSLLCSAPSILLPRREDVFFPVLILLLWFNLLVCLAWMCELKERRLERWLLPCGIGGAHTTGAQRTWAPTPSSSSCSSSSSSSSSRSFSAVRCCPSWRDRRAAPFPAPVLSSFSCKRAGSVLLGGWKGAWSIP